MTDSPLPESSGAAGLRRPDEQVDTTPVPHPASNELERLSARALMSQQSIAVAALDKDMNILWANETGERLAGKRIEASLGEPLSLLDVVHPDDLGVVAGAIASVDTRTSEGERSPSKNASVVVRIRSGDRWVHMDVHGVWTEADSGEMVLIVIARDVSAGQVAVEALRMIAAAAAVHKVMDKLLHAFAAQLGPVEVTVTGPPADPVLYASRGAGASGHSDPALGATEGQPHQGITVLQTSEPGWWSYALPFGAGSESVGTVVLEGHGLAPTPEWVREVTKALVDLVSIAVSQARVLDELERRAVTDPLTDLLNRTGLEHALVASADRPRSLMCIDLDGFKEVNDLHGHLVGDELLIAVATRIETCVRGGDCIARYGGDEFIVLSVDAERDEARALADRLINHISEPFMIAGHILHISASIGAVFAEPSQDDSDLIRRADELLYRAKNLGGHRVEMEPNSTQDPAMEPNST